MAQLLLEAVVIDKFRKTLGDLDTSLKQIQKTGQQANRSNAAELEKFHSMVGKTAGSIRGVLRPSLAALGLSAFAAGGAVGALGAAVVGVIASIKNFARSTLEMRSLSRETGVSVEMMKKLAAVGAIVGANTEAIPGNLKRLNEVVLDLKRNAPAVNALRAQLERIVDPVTKEALGANLLRDLKTLPPDQYVTAVIKFLDRIKEGVPRQRIAELLGVPDLTRFAEEGFKKYEERMGKFHFPSPTPADIKAAKDYADEAERMSIEFGKLRDAIGSMGVPWVADVLKDLNEVIDKTKALKEALGPGKTDQQRANATGDVLTSLGLGAPVEAGRSSGKALRKAYETGGVPGLLRELLGFGSAEASTGQQAYGALYGPGGQQAKDQIRLGVKEGVLEALRTSEMGGTLGGGGGGGGGTGFGGMSAARRVFGHPHIGGGGGGGGNTRLSNNSTPGWWTAGRQQHAYDRLIAAGVSPEGARGLVSRWVNVEASGGPGAANNIGGGHFGIAQWSRSRGKSIWGNPDFDKQLDLVIKELDSNEAAAGAMLRGAKTPEEGARGATAFERAEHYNKFTHTDDWTAKTLMGMRRLPIGKGGAASAGGGGTDPHKLGFDPKSVPYKDYFPGRSAGKIADYYGPMDPGEERRRETALDREFEEFQGRGSHGKKIPDKFTTYPEFNYGNPDPNFPEIKPDFWESRQEMLGSQGQAPWARPGRALRSQASAPFGGDGPTSGARTGKATMEISLKGFPPVNTRADGGSLFDRVELDRVRPLKQAI